MTVNLVQGTAHGERFTVGRADIRSDCRGGRFVSPSGVVSSGAVVRFEFEAHVISLTGKLVAQQSQLVKTDLVIFNRNNTGETGYEQKAWGKESLVGNHIYNTAENNYESYRDSLYGLFVIKKDDIPKTKCERAKTVWTSVQASIHAAKVRRGG